MFWSFPGVYHVRMNWRDCSPRSNGDFDLQKTEKVHQGKKKIVPTCTLSSIPRIWKAQFLIFKILINHYLQHFMWPVLSVVVHSNRYIGASQCGLIWISLMIKVVEHLFMCLFAIYTSYLVKCVFKCFGQFFYCFCFSPLNFEFVTYSEC